MFSKYFRRLYLPNNFDVYMFFFNICLEDCTKFVGQI
jgi:hypothetical protein